MHPPGDRSTRISLNAFDSHLMNKERAQGSHSNEVRGRLDWAVFTPTEVLKQSSVRPSPQKLFAVNNSVICVAIHVPIQVLSSRVGLA